MEDKGKSKKNLWITIAVCVAVVVLAVGAGVGLRWWQDRNKEEAAEFDPNPLPPTIAKSQELALTGDFTGAQDELSRQLANPNLSAQEKYELYYQQGATYANQGKPQEALASYKLAAAALETQSLYESMASIAQSMGDKQAAIDYYKRAIQLIQPNPMSEADKERYEASIRDLGGQP